MDGKFFFCRENTFKMNGEMLDSGINDNNNFVPSFLGSLCEIVGDCFHQCLGISLQEQIPLPKSITCDFTHTMTSKKMACSYYCLLFKN